FLPTPTLRTHHPPSPPISSSPPIRRAPPPPTFSPHTPLLRSTGGLQQRHFFPPESRCIRGQPPSPPFMEAIRVWFADPSAAGNRGAGGRRRLATNTFASGKEPLSLISSNSRQSTWSTAPSARSPCTPTPSRCRRAISMVWFIS